MLANILGLTRKYLVKCLEVHAERTGEQYETRLMPPMLLFGRLFSGGISILRLMMECRQSNTGWKNKKGDKWAILVKGASDKEQWVRMGDRRGQKSSLKILRRVNALNYA